jgi:hypothetical protein
LFDTLESVGVVVLPPASATAHIAAIVAPLVQDTVIVIDPDDAHVVYQLVMNLLTELVVAPLLVYVR